MAGLERRVGKRRRGGSQAAHSGPACRGKGRAGIGAVPCLAIAAPFPTVPGTERLRRRTGKGERGQMWDQTLIGVNMMGPNMPNVHGPYDDGGERIDGKGAWWYLIDARRVDRVSVVEDGVLKGGVMDHNTSLISDVDA